METARCMSTGLDFVYTSPGNATGFRGEPFNTEAFNDSRLMEELVVSNGSRYYGGQSLFRLCYLEVEIEIDSGHICYYL